MTPFDELERALERLERRFQDLPWQWDDQPLQPWLGTDEFAVDVVEEPDGFVVTADVPGFDRGEIGVRVADSTLWIEATRREDVEEGDQSYIRRERRHRSTRRSIQLPSEVETDGVKAELRNGVLTVTIPKAEPAAEMRDIEIESD